MATILTTPYPYILRVQTVLAPSRGDAVVEVRPRSSHVQLLLVGLSGDVIAGLCPFGQELRQMEGEVKVSPLLLWSNGGI